MELSYMIENRDKVLARMAQACAVAGRSTDSVRLVWVSKTQPIDAVEQAYAAGALFFGENRIQEAIDKFTIQRPGVHCHIIGPVQSNKMRKAVAVAHCIETVSSLEQVQRLNSLCSEIGKTLEVYFQVNTSLEDSKSGLAMESCVDFLNQLPQSSHLVYKGLMTIGKNTGNPEDSRVGFAWLRRLRDQFNRSEDPRFIHFTELSMGMTDDLEVAIEEGSTQVRIGSALFGARNYPV